MHIVEARSIDELWFKSMRAIMEHGTKISGIQEISNLIMVLTDRFAASSKFDSLFRKRFGDERIDYASSVTFVKPKKAMNGWLYSQNNPKAKWTETYWGRMWNWQGEVNQIEAAIKKLSGGKNTKMISISVYDPKSDHRKVMGGVPCMTSMDIKPRNGKLDFTVMFRSMRLTKSGYGDFHALCELAKWIAERANVQVGSLTLIATSGHIFYSGEEFQNTKMLMDDLKKARK